MCEISTEKQIYCGKRNSGDVVTSRFFVVIVVCLLCVASCNYIYRLSFSHGVKMFILSASVMIEEMKIFFSFDMAQLLKIIWRQMTDSLVWVLFVCVMQIYGGSIGRTYVQILFVFLKKFYLFVHKILFLWDVNLWWVDLKNNVQYCLFVEDYSIS